MFAIFQNERTRKILTQMLFVLALIAFASYLGSNAYYHLQKQGIATGFGFLKDRAGFSIIQSLIPFNEDSSYARVFLVGLLNTLLVSVLGILFATLIGFIIGVARVSTNHLIRLLATSYIEVMRNIPLLLQIYIWYFVVLRSLPAPRQSLQFFDAFFVNNRGFYLPFWQELQLSHTLAIFFGLGTGLFFLLPAYSRSKLHFVIGSICLCSLAISFTSPLSFPELKGFNFQGGLVLIPELLALLTALSTYTAAFIAEIVRAGIESVSKGQWEAAQALGLNRRQTTQWIVIPQAMQVIIPPTTSQYLNLTKNSSLAAAIAYPDLVSVFAGTTLNQTGQAIEVICLTMLVYLTISLLISGSMNIYNQKVKLEEKAHV